MQPAVVGAGLMKGLILLAVCIAVSGCTARLHGHQAMSGGATTTTTSGAVSGSIKSGSTKLVVSSGQPVSPRAHGGYLRLSGDAAAVLLVGLILIDTVNYLVAQFSAPPAPLQREPAAGAISQTCSCYGYEGVPAPQ